VPRGQGIVRVDFKLYVITDRKQTKLPLIDAVRLALEGGVKAIQLREKDLSVRNLLNLAQEVRSITREFEAQLIINDRVDVAIAVKADGVHLGRQSMPPEPVRRLVGRDMLIGVSTHSVAEARAAEAGGADFITFGPVFFTASKAHFVAPVGLECLTIVKSQVKIPVFALGGMKSGNISEALRCGADGVSLISAIFGADDIKLAATSIIEEIR
jgi:thiamine-phosphate pyrophosphorylase